MNKLNILVVDDSKNHRRAAESLLKNHNLTVVGSYDEGLEALTSHTDYEKAKTFLPDLLGQSGLSRSFNPYQGEKDASEADKQKYHAAYKKSHELATTHPNFDIVLLDLMMPASRAAQGSKGIQFVGKEMPIGTFLILLALNAGVKNIGMVTDMSHHDHPASAALDPINRQVINIGETKIFATNNVGSRYFDTETGEILTYKFLQSEEGKAKYPEVTGNSDCRYTGVFSGKGWDTILKNLLRGKFEQEGWE